MTSIVRAARPLLLAAGLVGLVAGGFPSPAHAQAKYTAVKGNDLQAGGGFVLAIPDYGQDKMKGIFGFFTFDFKPHIGIEFNVHQVNAPGSSKLYERTYELGGRYVRHYGIWHPYVKALYGRGVFNYDNDVANLAYNLGSAGGGVDVNILRHVNLRADYEYQHWFGFRGYVSQGYVVDDKSSISPQLISIGAAYHF